MPTAPAAGTLALCSSVHCQPIVTTSRHLRRLVSRIDRLDAEDAGQTDDSAKGGKKLMRHIGDRRKDRVVHALRS